MSHTIALSRKAHRIAVDRQLDVARVAIVLTSAFALIFAGQPLPL